MTTTAYDPRMAEMFLRVVPTGEHADATVSLITSLAAPGDRVLELGCGAGRILLPLAERGLVCVGIDGAEGLVDLARERASSIGVADRCEIRLGDFREPASHGEEFDLALCVGITLTLQPPADRRAVLARLASCLVPGGRCVIDAHNPEWVRTAHLERPDELTHLAGPGVRARSDLAGDRWTMEYVPDGAPERTATETIHLVTADDLAAEAAVHGLRETHRFGWWDGRPPTPSDSAYVLVLTRDTTAPHGSAQTSPPDSPVA